MKKRSSLVIILILFVLSGISLFLYFSRSKLSTVDEDARAFSYKDTAAITKIFIADKDNNRSTLVRTKDGWYVNEKFRCRTDAVLNLLEAIKLVDVKMSVPKAAKESVIKFMSFNAVKIEIYAGEKKVKQYYVGHETSDSEGSYMLLTDLGSGKNFKDPFVCFIPGFNGFLQPRYIAEENDWRDRIVMNYIPPQMSQIKVEHLSVPADSSFTIDLPDANTFILKDLKGTPHSYSDERMRQYLVYFQNISYEVLLTGKNIQLQDSLKAQKPFSELTISLKDKSQNIFKMYRKKYTGDNAMEHGVKFEYDPDRFYLSFDNGRQWALCQYFVFGKLLVNCGYFSPVASVKK